jgi:hypothetical protein
MERKITPARQVASGNALPASSGGRTTGTAVVGGSFQLVSVLIECERYSDVDQNLQCDPRLHGLLRNLKGGSDEIIGILGKCSVPGCDVHTIAFGTDVIVKHIGAGEAIDQVFLLARRHIDVAEGGVVAIIVFAGHLEELMVNGHIRRIQKPPA